MMCRVRARWSVSGQNIIFPKKMSKHGSILFLLHRNTEKHQFASNYLLFNRSKTNYYQGKPSKSLLSNNIQKYREKASRKSITHHLTHVLPQSTLEFVFFQTNQYLRHEQKKWH
ncbi:hypothetical protein HA050_18705 [Iodobacter sp. HSC-16F04]|uniref:Tyrosine-type recombinase/integrase n=1 Tax=Iodobacter violaceini TaxID=3044271 RepID=A0ABX0L3V3_9NEIS|nr:hypothetical protein [Iodobacter violacea]NHQ88141.1 hypothetical protein [Iodobacter violacea]